MDPQTIERFLSNSREALALRDGPVPNTGAERAARTAGTNRVAHGLRFTPGRAGKPARPIMACSYLIWTSEITLRAAD